MLLTAEEALLIKRALVAVVLGGTIGLERQLRGKPAGIRTSALVCLASCLFVLLATDLPSGNGEATARVLAQLVTGVGFLGAGVILTKEGLVRGMTSASVLWVLAAIGAGVGLGRILPSAIVTLLVISILVGIEVLERAIRGLRRGVHRHGNED